MKFCEIHPDTALQQKAIKVKRSLKLGWSCEKCDQLVEELKTKRAPTDRHKGQ